MNSKWFKDCKTEEEKNKKRKELNSYEAAFNAIIEILEEPVVRANFDIPGWEGHMAYHAGRKDMYEKLMSLINLERKTKPNVRLNRN